MTMMMMTSAAALRLTKLHIDDECGLEDRGVEALCRALQTNRTLRFLCLRSCGLGHRSAVALSRFIAMSETIEDINVNGNRMAARCSCETILRAMANRGARSRLKAVWMKSQTPAITVEDSAAVYSLGTALAVRVHAEQLSAEAETMLEMQADRDVDDDETIYRRLALQDLAHDGRIEDAPSIAFAKHLHI